MSRVFLQDFVLTTGIMLPSRFRIVQASFLLVTEDCFSAGQWRVNVGDRHGHLTCSTEENINLSAADCCRCVVETVFGTDYAVAVGG
jgi:hypothetical protein